MQFTIEKPEFDEFIFDVNQVEEKYYLSEKIKAIQQELGDLDESGAPLGDIEQLEEAIEKAEKMAKEAAA